MLVLRLVRAMRLPAGADAVSTEGGDETDTAADSRGRATLRARCPKVLSVASTAFVGRMLKQSVDDTRVRTLAEYQAKGFVRIVWDGRCVQIGEVWWSED